jgi:hypothetical protein
MQSAVPNEGASGGFFLTPGGLFLQRFTPVSWTPTGGYDLATVGWMANLAARGEVCVPVTSRQPPVFYGRLRGRGLVSPQYTGSARRKIGELVEEI